MTYNIERTICDCIRSRNQMDMAIVIGAVNDVSWAMVIQAIRR